MTNKCANPKCGKDIAQIEGRKKRKYCSTYCTSTHWQSINKVASVKKYAKITIEEWEQLKKQVALLSNPDNASQNKPRESKKDESKVVAPPKPKKADIEPANNATEENKDTVNPNIERIAKINELLLSSPKYLPKEKRSNLERELKNLTNLPQTNTD